jgi:hypothetical protein
VASQGWARDGWLDVDVDEVRGVWCRDGDVKGFWDGRMIERIVMFV